MDLHTPQPNLRLSYHRKLQLWTQEKVADELYNLCNEAELKNHGIVDKNMVSRWERGLHTPKNFWQGKLCKLFGKNAEELGFINQDVSNGMPDSPQTESSSSMNRRNLFRELAALGFTIVLGPSELINNQQVLQIPEVLNLSSTYEESFSFFENDITTRWGLYYTGGPIRASQGLDLNVREIAKLARLTEGTGWHKRILKLLTMGYQLQTCILRDMMKYDQAHLAYQRAFHVAQELEECELIASALAREGVTLIQQEKPKEAIIYLDGALNMIDGQNFPTLKGHILQALSEAYAKAKQSQDCWQSIGQAEYILAKQEQAQERSLVRFNAASFAAQKGVNAVLLEDYRRAIELIDESLLTYDPTLIRGRARMIAQKAEALYGAGLIDASVATAEQAVTLANSVGVSKTIVRVKTLHAALIKSPWRKEQSVARLGATLTM